jgi:hypothetical protein
MTDETLENQGSRELTIDEMVHVSAGSIAGDVAGGMILAGAIWVVGKVVDWLCHTKH